MKTLTGTLLFVCGLTLFPLIVSAAKAPTHLLPEYTVQDLTLPIPDKVVAPRVNGQFAGQKVRMQLTVGTDGRATKISQKGISPDQQTNDLAATMQMVLRQWQFKPAMDKQGNAVAVKVILPVEVVKAKGNAKEYATIALAKPIFLARVN